MRFNLIEDLDRTHEVKAVSPEEFKTFDGNLEVIVDDDGTFLVNTRNGLKEVPEEYLPVLEDQYAAFKSKEAGFNREQQAEIDRKWQKTEYNPSSLINKVKDDIKTARGKKYSSEIQPSKSKSLPTVDMGKLGNFSDLILQIKDALQNMIIMRIQEITHKKPDFNMHPSEIAIADSSNYEVLVDQKNSKKVKEFELIKDESIFLKIWMDKSGSFTENKSDFADNIYRQLRAVSERGLTYKGQTLLSPNKLHIELHVFDSRGMERIDADSNGNFYSEEETLKYLRKFGGNNDGHAKALSQIRKESSVGNAEHLESVMFITDYGGASGVINNISPLEVNGVVFVLYVDTMTPEDMENTVINFSEYGVLDIDNTSDFIYGKYGTHIYTFQV